MAGMKTGRWRLWLILAAACDAALGGWIGTPIAPPTSTRVATPQPSDPLLARWWYTPEAALADEARLDDLAAAIAADVRTERTRTREWQARRQILAWAHHPDPTLSRTARKLLAAYERRQRP